MKLYAIICEVDNSRFAWELICWGVNVIDIVGYVQDHIDYFNSTLRPYERRRRVISVSIVDGKFDSTKPITKNNDMCRVGRDGDYMKCVECGIMAKNTKVSCNFRESKEKLPINTIIVYREQKGVLK